VGGSVAKPLSRLLLGVQVAASLCLLVLILALLAGTVPSFVGAESFVVLSGSMEPTIGVGDLTVVVPVRPDNFEVGDIITYRTTQSPDVIVTHRLIGKGQDEQGRMTFETKGDANEVSDQVAIAPGAVLGRVAYSIPKVGYLVEFSRRPEGKVLLIGLPGLLLAVDYLFGMRRRRKAELWPVHGEAGELVARGRVAMNNGGTNAAVELFDRAIAADPHLDEAWLLKASCLPKGPERLACLRAALTVNPNSVKLKKALEIATAAASVAG
jgi:signal peptidase I